MKQSKYFVETNVLAGVECSDEGRWLNYDTFAGEGDSYDEVIESCAGFTQDQDGGDGPEVTLDELPAALHNQVVTAVRERFAAEGWPLHDARIPRAPADRSGENGEDI